MSRRWALVLVALPRLVAWPLSQNLYGDAIARTWLAHRWLEHPHVIGSFDQGAMQFGALHVYLLALAEWLWPDLLNAGRAASLVVGVASVLPLRALALRLFGPRAAAVAVFGFAWWGMHVQCSVTSSSEALNLLLVFWALERFERWHADGPREALMTAALLLNLACATRYDSWLYVPLLAGLVAWRSRSVQLVVGFTALSAAYAVAFSFGNWVDRGSPLFPFAYIDAFHRSWFVSEQAAFGAERYRWWCALFWPGSALAMLTPLVGLAGLAGLVRAWREGRGRWLVVMVVVPTVLYTARALTQSFVPASRFSVKEVALLLPFVWPGAEWALGWASARVRSLVVGLGAVACVGWTSWLGVFCFERTGEWERSLRPIAPVSTLEPELAAVARALRAEAGQGGVLVVDVDPRGYDDLILAYFSGFPYERQARRRSPLYLTQLGNRSPTHVVRFDGGQLVEEGALKVTDDGARLDGARFEAFGPPAPTLWLYRRAP